MTTTRGPSWCRHGMWMTVLLAATGCGGQAPGSETGLLGKLRSALSDNAPDLRVSAVHGPSSAVPGLPFSVDVTVCNEGTETADINTDVFLSEDALIQPSDMLLASRPVNLKPGQCSTLDMNVDMGVSQAGSYHLGAITDSFDYVSELNEDNNSLVGNTLTVDAKPDLVLTAVTGPSRRSPYTPDAPVFFTVCNQGLPSSNTNVDLFLSTDTTISRNDDLFFANVWVDALAAGECRTQSVPTHTPPEGIFYLGGIVDPFDSLPEILEDNNVLVGHRMAIGYGPDLVITSVQAPASARPGEPLGISATVCNQGFQPSYFSELAVRLSDDATVTPDDPMLGFAPVGDLDSGMCATVSVTGPATPPSGTWYLGTFADASQFVLELDEANNASAPRAITFGSDSDLTVSLKAPALAPPGGSFRYTATVCNQGTSLGEPTTLDILLSSDPTFSDDDLLLGGAQVPQLAAGECTELSQEIPSYAPPSSYFLGARVDGSHGVPELREDNNLSSPSPFVIGQGVDLIVTSVRAPASALPGNPFEATITVCNQGSDLSPGAMLALKLAPLDVATPVDLPAGTAFVGGLAPGACENVTASVLPDMPMPLSGAWKLLALADSDHSVPELIESNNSASSNRIGISYSADFVITSVSGPTRLSPYSSPDTVAFVTVCNQGTSSQGAQAELYFSQDAFITLDDMMAGNEPVGYLDPGQCRTTSVRIHAPSEGTFYLGARIPPLPQELFLDDNVAIGNLVAIGNKADLVVTSVQAPTSVRPGELVSATATVCNQGFAPSYFSQVAVYLSQDSTVDPTQDMPIGFAPVGHIDMGQCASATVTGTAFPAGTHFLIASADDSNQVPELYEDNNTSAPRALSLGSGSDLTVSLQAPAVARPGEPLNLTATVCNQGNALSAPSHVDFLFSTDATLSQQDVFLGGIPVDLLAPGACATLSQQVPVPPENGFLGAIVDGPNVLPELREDNNTSAASALVTGFGPDLTVTSVKAPPSTMPGNPFEATVTVCNQGSDFSPGSMLALKLAPLDVATPVELPAGTSFVDGLAPGTCENVTTSVLPDMPMPLSGAWKLLALADSDHLVSELIESNNSASSNRIGISYSADFVITSVSGPTRLSPYGSPDTVAFVTVCNQGTSSAGADLELYFSQDVSITRDDMMAGNEPAGYLDPGQCRTASVRIHAPSEGTFYLGARVRPAPQELFLDDNVATGNLVAIGNKADLVVTSVQAPTSVQPGEQISATATVCNQGFAPSYFSQVAVYLSQDATVDPTQDLLIDVAPVGDIDMGQCASTTVTGTAYVPAGTYFLVASADESDQVPELYEDNNTSAPRALSIGSGSDLTVSLQAPAVARPGEPLSLTATVCNQGNALSAPSHVDFLFSTDATLSQQDVFLGGIPVDQLAPGACATLSQQVPVPPENGFLGAIVDGPNVLPELREDNNTSAASALVTGFGPDLTVTSVKAPPSTMPGNPFEATVTVCNQGSDFSPGSMLALKLAPLDVATPVELPAGTSFVGGLAPGACENVTASVLPDMPMPLSGAWKLLALADSDHSVPELIESNNSASSSRIGISYSADFVITSVSGPTRLSPYSSPDTVAFVTVCNQGAASAGADLELYFSQDASITRDDMMAGNEPAGYLDPGQCRTTSVRIHAPSEGTFYLGARVRPAPQELFLDDNVATGNLVAIGNKADLVVTSVQAPSSVRPGDPLSLTATVCNQGFELSYYSQVAVYLSQDATVDPTQDLLIDVAPVGDIDMGQCASTTVTGTAYVPAGTYFLVASADESDQVPELYEDNNTSAPRALSIGSGSDLTVSLQAPAVARPGEPLSLTATVCNQGNALSAPSHVDFLFSTDATLSQQDVFLGGIPVDQLAPGACATLSQQVPVPPENGFLGAIVDGPNVLPELREDNNTSAASALVTGFGPDLTVTSVKAPPSTMPGNPFEATVTVCNQGSDFSPGSMLALKLAPLDVATPVELPAGTSFVGGLAPGACENVTASVLPDMPMPLSGAWKLLALADSDHSVPELIESNNSASSSRIGISYSADFVITSVSGPTRLSPYGSPDTVAFVTVCNQGTSSAGADAELFLSQADSTSGDDMPIGYDPVGDLDPGQCRTASVHIGGMPSEGTFYLGAHVRPAPQELFLDDNAVIGHRVTIGSRPDLVVTSVQAPASVQPGAPLDASATVCNQGTTPSYYSNVEVLLSPDTDVNKHEDFRAGVIPVGMLEASQCTTVRLTDSVPLPSGTWYLAALADASEYEPELDEDNNLSDLGVLVVGLGADLTVSVDTPTSARPGMNFDVLATVCNQGTAPSQHSHVDVVLSSDETLTQSDFLLGGAPVEPLAPGACTSLSVTTSASQPEGIWFLGAIVDGPNAQPELREDNNASTASVFGLGQGPDLVVTSVQAPTASHPDTTFPATLEVCNHGTAPSPSTQVELKLAAQGLGSPVELPAGTAPVGPLAPGACENVAANVAAAVPMGTWKLLALVDAQHFVPELVESNNSASSQRIGIGYAPDFVITSVEAPALISPWEGATVHITVCNQGSDSGAGAPDIGVMLSQDASITRNDMHLMSVPVNDLPPGECRTVDAAIDSTPEGTFHLGAILTVWMPELFRDNNTAVGPRVVIGARPELVVTSVQAPTSVQGGGVFTSAVNVCNQGFDFSNPTNVEVRLAGQEPESLLVGNAIVPELEPGHCQTVSVESQANVPPAAYTLEAVVDPHNQVWELLEDNNRGTGHTVTVTN
ncbi:hypothetical protein JRI60_47855 [Archangium violaceum]|uniref:CARDB domain-containing protein n=1 Tax=Archangium violaceum TaxID=83451 RepID=UPI00194FCC31|nr:CARDB domain-containing protein [Archangium violaceum]QRN96631.1 hypothetical protein JRI60_47855 [Archangium violaceum]